MRIAIVINTSWNIYNFRMGLIRKLMENHTVYAIAPQDRYSSLLVDNGCRYIPLEMDNTGTNPLRDGWLLWRLAGIYRKIQPDVVLHFTVKPNVYGSLAAALAGIRVINNVSGLGTLFIKKSPATCVALIIYRFAFRFPAKVFFQNEHDRQLFIDKRLVKREKTACLPGSGVDLKKFPLVPFKRNAVFTFLLMARLLYDKGLSEYAEAVRIVRNNGITAKFQLLGALDPLHSRGIDAAVLSGWEKEYNMDYLGETDDVKPFIQQADCVLLPSYREGTPKSLLEAASSGKPLIATDVPGCKDIVEDNYNGFLCRVKDPADLADKMQRMLALNNQELQMMGLNSRNKAEMKFDEQIVINKYLKAIGDITASEMKGGRIVEKNQSHRFRFIIR